MMMSKYHILIVHIVLLAFSYCQFGMEKTRILASVQICLTDRHACISVELNYYMETQIFFNPWVMKNEFCEAIILGSN